MQYGLNENNERILAEFTGQRSNCPMCGTTLIASCGELYINHWKHDRYQSCDAWFEPETHSMKSTLQILKLKMVLY